jgi:hypothetical protein
MPDERPFEEMLPSLKRAAAALRDAEIPYVLAGGIAAWARGGAESDHDIDFVLKPDDAERALGVLEEAGLDVERPPEPWLFKAYDGEVLIDLIFAPAGLRVTDEVIERSDVLEVWAVPMHVMRPEDILVTKLCAMTEQTIDYRSCLAIARSLREQIDWDSVQRRTGGSPFAKAFLTLVEELDIAELPS